jgi:hypothetical protein
MYPVTTDERGLEQLEYELSAIRSEMIAAAGLQAVIAALRFEGVRTGAEVRDLRQITPSDLRPDDNVIVGKRRQLDPRLRRLVAPS